MRPDPQVCLSREGLSNKLTGKPQFCRSEGCDTEPGPIRVLAARGLSVVGWVLTLAGVRGWDTPGRVWTNGRLGEDEVAPGSRTE